MAKRPKKQKTAPARNVPRPAAEGAGPEAQRLRRQCDIAVAVIAVVMLIIVCALSTTHVTWPDDQYSDMNTLMSGENFATHGLFRLHLLPVHYIGAMTVPPAYYTHYPPLPNIVNGLMRILGINSLAVMRILCGLLGIAGLICMYRAFAPDIGSLPAACGLGFIATSGYFFTYCISVHQHTYNIFFMGVFLLLFTRAVRSDRPATRAWTACWVVLMLESLTSFEFILYPQVFAWVYVLATGRFRRQWRGLLFLATAPVTGVLLHFLQNGWALGWSVSAADALDAFRRPGRGPAQDRWLTLKQVPQFVQSHSHRLYYWSLPVVSLLALLWLALAGGQQPASATGRRAGVPLVGALIASLTWYVFMPVHTIKHPHTMSQLLPLTMIVMGGAIAEIVRWLARRPAPVHERGLAVLAAVVVVFAQTQTIATCFQRASIQRPPSFYLFEAMGEAAFGPKVAVLTNTYADAQLAYFIRRPLWRSPTPMLPFDPESLASLQKRLPEDWRIRYYIYDMGGDRQPFKFLASTCPGRFVTIPGMRSPYGLVIFDISGLLDPAGRPPVLKPDVRKAQLEGKFPRWDPPGFQERLRDVLERHGKLRPPT